MRFKRVLDNFSIWCWFDGYTSQSDKRPLVERTSTCLFSKHQFEPVPQQLKIEGIEVLREAEVVCSYTVLMRFFEFSAQFRVLETQKSIWYTNSFFRKRTFRFSELKSGISQIELRSIHGIYSINFIAEVFLIYT